jgi:hypothetical protein
VQRNVAFVKKETIRVSYYFVLVRDLKIEDILKNPRAYAMPKLMKESVASKAATKVSPGVIVRPSYVQLPVSLKSTGFTQ